MRRWLILLLVLLCVGAAPCPPGTVEVAHDGYTSCTSNAWVSSGLLVEYYGPYDEEGWHAEAWTATPYNGQSMSYDGLVFIPQENAGPVPWDQMTWYPDGTGLRVILTEIDATGGAR